MQDSRLVVQACSLSERLTADALALDGRDDRRADLGALGLLPKSSSSSSSSSSADASSDSSTAGAGAAGLQVMHY